MDNRSKESRSKNMSNIKSSGTKPEETVRKYLFNQGFRYRKNVKNYLVSQILFCQNIKQ